MRKKEIVVYSVIVALFVGIIWLMLANSSVKQQNRVLDSYVGQLQFLLGIGPLKSTHIHADVKVYINGDSIDFSQKKYQLTTNFIHFEDGVGDVVHIHATGMTVGQMIRGVGGSMSSKCLDFGENKYCNDKNKILKLYVNGQPNEDFDNYVVDDLDKILISFGDETPAEIQAQIATITNLARKNRNV